MRHLSKVGDRNCNFRHLLEVGDSSCHLLHDYILSRHSVVWFSFTFLFNGGMPEAGAGS